MNFTLSAHVSELTERSKKEIRSFFPSFKGYCCFLFTFSTFVGRDSRRNDDEGCNSARQNKEEGKKKGSKIDNVTSMHVYVCVSAPQKKKGGGEKACSHSSKRKQMGKKNTVLLLLLVHVEETMTSKRRRTICPISNAKTAKKKKSWTRSRETHVAHLHSL